MRETLAASCAATVGGAVRSPAARSATTASREEMAANTISYAPPPAQPFQSASSRARATGGSGPLAMLAAAYSRWSRVE